MIAAIEYASKSLIKGVAYDLAAPHQIIQIEVYHNGRLLVQLVPDAFRWDLKQYGAGYHGFIYQIPQGLSGELDLRIKGSSLQLQGSPVVLEPELIRSALCSFCGKRLDRAQSLGVGTTP